MSEGDNGDFDEPEMDDEEDTGDDNGVFLYFTFFFPFYFPICKQDSSFQILDLSKERPVPKEQRKTRPYLTKYERTRILGARALQISLNAPPLVNVGNLRDPLQIADLVC